MSYRSGHQSEYQHHHPQAHAARPLAGPQPPPRCSTATAIPSSMPASSPGRSGCILDRGRHDRRARHVVGGNRHLFRVSRRRVTRLIARQAEMQYAYEDRIAELRAKVDRTTSRQLLDQEQFRPKTRPDHEAPDRAGIPRHCAGRHSRYRLDRIDPAAGAWRCNGSAASGTPNPRRSAIP